MASLISKQGKHLFKHFKALGNPIRFLIIYKMLDGRPYTKNEILDYVSALSGVPQTTVDRHFRTLLKYGIIRMTGKSHSYGERGRKPLLYVLAVDSLTFYANLFTYLLDGVTDRRLKLIERSVSETKTLLESINYVRLGLYLVGRELSEEVSVNLSKTLDSCISLISLVRETVRPKTPVIDCENAIKLLDKMSSSQMLLRQISQDKMRELLYVAHIESGLPVEKLGLLLGIKSQTKLEEYDDLWREIETSYNNDLTTFLKLLISNAKCTDVEGSYVISLTNNLIKYFSSSITNRDIVRLILTI
ncbi:MAG: winged helix-turn-helix domain-containing protein [Zestosphaera sp.]